jgi:hypothetical protein
LGADLDRVLGFLIRSHIEAAGGPSAHLSAEDCFPSTIKASLDLSEYGKRRIDVLLTKHQAGLAAGRWERTEAGQREKEGLPPPLPPRLLLPRPLGSPREEVPTPQQEQRLSISVRGTPLAKSLAVPTGRLTPGRLSMEVRHNGPMAKCRARGGPVDLGRQSYTPTSTFNPRGSVQTAESPSALERPVQTF